MWIYQHVYVCICIYSTQKELMSSVTEISSLKAHIKELEDKLMQQVQYYIRTINLCTHCNKYCVISSCTVHT